MLPRTIDKARAAIARTLGEYIYDCPMDKRLFQTLGLDGDTFLAIVAKSPDDAAVIDALAPQCSSLDAAAIEAHNADIAGWSPKSDGGRARFAETLARVAPGRSDITTWTDLLDIEEGRIPAAS